jgi:hypothetical protein
VRASLIKTLIDLAAVASRLFRGTAAMPPGWTANEASPESTRSTADRGTYSGACSGRAATKFSPLK